MLALPILPGRPSIVPPLRNSPVDCHRQKKLHHFWWSLYAGITYLTGQAKYGTAVKKQSGGLF